MQRGVSGRKPPFHRVVGQFENKCPTNFKVCRQVSTSETCPAAAERQKICSPRREPWVRVKIESQPRSGGTLESMMREFRPSGAVSLTLGLIPWLTPWATDLLPLRGLDFDRRCLIRASFSLSPGFDKLKLVGHQTGRRRYCGRPTRFTRSLKRGSGRRLSHLGSTVSHCI